MKHWHSLSIMACLASAMPSCLVDVEDGPVDVVFTGDRGRLTTHWTIEGTASASDCERVGAGSLELVTFDQLGSILSRTYAPCEEFTISIELPEGQFAAEARLVTEAALPITDAQRVEDLLIRQDETVVITVDFPSSAFH